MRHEIVLAPEAVEDLERLSARWRAMVRDALEKHLRHQPARVSKARIKRLRGLRRPQFRLRVDEITRFLRYSGAHGRGVGDCAEGRSRRMAARNGKTRMKKVALNRIQSELAKFLRLAAKEEVIITDKGKPAGVLIGFASEDDWFDYQLENDPRFLRRIKSARRSLRAGKGTRLEDLQDRLDLLEARTVNEGKATYRAGEVKKKLRPK